jgi:large subunit ribosomal protein L9
MANPKLLLREDVDGLGRKGQVVNVRPGYARNYLLPRGLAYIADPRTLRLQARLQEERQKQAIVDQKEAEQLAARIEGLTLTTVVKVDQEGHMYGSVSAADIVNLMQEQNNVEIEKRYVQLKHPIKVTGDHTIQLKLKEGIPASVLLKIVPEDVKGAKPQ